MSEQKPKGYTVRGTFHDDSMGSVAVYSYGYGDGFGTGAPEIRPLCIWDLDTATACRAFMVRAQCTDVRISAVAEDGTETPLPTYDEALTEIGQLRAELAQTEEALRTATDDTFRLNAEAARLRLQKAASHEAWARYVTAAIEDRDAQFAEEQEMAGAEEWRARTQKNLAIATAALRDLGVDVNTLLNAKTRTT